MANDKKQMINPYENGCGREIFTERKGCVYCGDSEGYICDQCKFIKKILEDKNIKTKNIKTCLSMKIDDLQGRNN